MNSRYTDSMKVFVFNLKLLFCLVWSTTKFDWTARIRAIVQNSNSEVISFDKLKKEVNKLIHLIR
jgi:hypothetical protein